MKNKSVFVGGIILLSFLLSALADDLSGRWSAQIPEGQGSVRTIFSFGVDGTKLVGTVSNPQGISPISEGKINGNEITFTISRNFDGKAQKFVFSGKVREDEINFISKVENGKNQLEFTAKKESHGTSDRPSARFITLP